MRFGGIVSTRRDSVAEGPVVGWVLGDGVVRLRLFGEKVGAERGREIVLVTVLVLVLLRLGVEVLLSGWLDVGSVSSDFMIVCSCAIVVLGALAVFGDSLPLCRNCCSLPWKLVVLLTGISSSAI
jgi:hypothetical protein